MTWQSGRETKPAWELPWSGCPGSVRVETSIAGVVVKMDNVKSGTTPVVFDNVPAGTHVLEFSNLRVGNQFYTAGEPTHIDVSPAETTLVSKTLVEGKGFLTITDAPEGSVVTINGNAVDSAKAITDGIEVPAGWLDVVVLSSTSQQWTWSPLVTPGTSNFLDIYKMTWRLPVAYSMSWMMPKHSNNPKDWDGIVPAWTTFPIERDWGDQPGTLASKGYACRDDNYLYFKYEFTNGAPRKQLSRGIRELDYVQVINTTAGELTVVTRFTQSAFGTSQKITLGFRDPQKSSWTSLPDDKTAFSIGEGTLEIAVPLDVIRQYLKGERLETGMFVLDSYDPRSRTPFNISLQNGSRLRQINFGLR